MIKLNKYIFIALLALVPTSHACSASTAQDRMDAVVETLNKTIDAEDLDESEVCSLPVLVRQYDLSETCTALGLDQ